MMPIHWGAFKLALHSWDDPVKRASKTAENLQIQMLTPKIGEAIIIDKDIKNTTNWWKLVD
jgi:L-ascorbate metabolism protein UlaG (beta-lactamase superfamily)